jgi:predicted Zn finger-like uncharacterized protein
MATCPECGASIPFKAAPNGASRKRVRCPKCDNLVLPIADKTPARTAPQSAPPASTPRKAGHKPALKPPPTLPTPATAGMDDEIVGFSDYEDPAEARRKREEEEAKATKVKQKKAEVKVKIRNIGDLDRWNLVNQGMLFVEIGAYCWGFAMLLHALALILGMLSGPDYTNIALEFLYSNNRPLLQVGEREPVRLLNFMFAYIYGRDFWKACYYLVFAGQCLYYVQFGLWMTAYVMFLRGCPDRYGAKFQSVFLLSCGGFNALLHLFLVLLPLCQAYEFVICPLIGPEMSMGTFGAHRRFPLHVQWSGSPVFDALTAITVFTSRYLEWIVLGAYIWTVGLNIREEEPEKKGLTVMNFSAGVLFVMLCFQMGSVSGTSPVLIGLLQVIYFLWFAFSAGTALMIVLGCRKTREVLAKYLTGKID